MSGKHGNPVPSTYKRTMIRYLFGELSESEKLRLEELVFREENYFVQLQIVEEQLIDDYLANTLPPDQRQKFESGYLISDRRKQKLQFAQTLKQTLATLPASQLNSPKQSDWMAILNNWQLPVWKFGLAAVAVMLFILGGWFVIRSRQSHSDLAQMTTASPSQTTMIATASSSTTTPSPIPSPVVTQPRAHSTPANPTKHSADRSVISVLSPEQFRDQDATSKANSVVIPHAVTTVTLQLRHTPNPAYFSFRATLETVSGQTLLIRDHLKSKAGVLIVHLPAEKLSTDDYVITLFGKNARGEFVEINDYTFQIIKK